MKIRGLVLGLDSEAQYKRFCFPRISYKILRWIAYIGAGGTLSALVVAIGVRSGLTPMLLAFSLFAGAFSLLTFRFSQLGIYVSTENIVAVNPLSTQVIRSNDVLNLVIKERRILFNEMKICYLRVRRRQYIPVWSLMTSTGSGIFYDESRFLDVVRNARVAMRLIPPNGDENGNRRSSR